MNFRLERRSASRLLGLSAALVSSALIPCASTLSVACSPCNPNGHEPIRYTDGKATGDIYETGMTTDEMLHFPSGRIYELEHHLGVCPPVILPYISFVPRPISGEAQSRVDNFAIAAGNEALVEGCDKEIIRLRNDTCADFYLRVVAVASGGGSGGEGGAP